MMKFGKFLIALFFFNFSTVLAWSEDDLSTLVNSALVRAGKNASQLRKALAEAPESQKEGVQFLVAHMPDRDLKSLSAEFLLKHVRFAYKAWNKAPWKDRVPKAIFFNDVLPYASINERRDDWREDFYKRFRPLVAKAKSPTEAVVILNRKIFGMLKVRFSRQRPKADQSPYETIQAGKASCTGLSVLLIDACRAVGVPARLAGTPLWTNKSGNHSWVEIWDGQWHYTGAAEPSGDKLNRGWFTGRAATAKKDHRLHAIYATSFKPTGITFPLVWDRTIKYVHAVNVTDRYTKSAKENHKPATPKTPSPIDVEASLHALAELKAYLKKNPKDRPALAKQEFATVALTRKDAQLAKQLLWSDHVRQIKNSRTREMKARRLTSGKLQMPFHYSVHGKKPDDGRSLLITLHGGGNTTRQINDREWNIHKRHYRVKEGVYVAPRAPTNTWNMWHQSHVDQFLGRLIENLIVFEDVNPNRVYLIGVSAGGDGVYYLAPRMADRFAAATMVAGHPNSASPLGLRNLPFSIQMGAKDSRYGRNKAAQQWGKRLDDLQMTDPQGYTHWTKIHPNRGHGMRGSDAPSIPWMAKFTRDPFPVRIVWQMSNHRRFYWLATKRFYPGNVIRAERKEQLIHLQAKDLPEIIIRVNDEMLDLDRTVLVKSQGKLVYEGRIPRTIRTLSKTIAERGDPASIFSGEIVVPLKKEQEGFTSMFDGKTLNGWHSVPKKNAGDWSVRDGVIVGEGSANRLVYLVWKEQKLRDFELKLRYRLPGKGNTGIEIRSRPDKTGRRPFVGYHADLGHVGIGDHILGAWDFHFAGRREYPCPRGTKLVIDKGGQTRSTKIPNPVTLSDIRPKKWNDVHIIARGNRFQFYINGKLASEFTDNTTRGQLDKGAIGLQIHDKGMRVEFKDIRLKRLHQVK
ncbi:MAG: family 16 glycoside hydrolase [Gemmataceae bacterium]